MLYVLGPLAGFAAFCPWGGRRPCPDPRIGLLGLVSGAVFTVACDFLFLGPRAPVVSDLFVVALGAFLFSHLIKTLFFPWKES
jgi:hypothetical protein